MSKNKIIDKVNCGDCGKDLSDVPDADAIYCEEHDMEVCEKCYHLNHKECDDGVKILQKKLDNKYKELEKVLEKDYFYLVSDIVELEIELEGNCNQ